MIYERKHVQALIRKKVLGILTREEQAEYQLSKRIYTEDEFDEMIAETLLEMDDELPADRLADWKPDFDAIRSIAEQRRRNRKNPVWRVVGWGAAAILPIIAVFTYWYRWPEAAENYLVRACSGLSREMQVPLTESAVNLQWGDAGQMQVGREQYGEILHKGNIGVFKTEEGVLQLRQREGEIAGAEQPWLVVATGPQQQAMVELPDGTRIRLNAQSALRYTPAEEENKRVTVLGEVYVQRPEKLKVVPLFISTRNGYVKSFDGDFAMLSQEHFTRAATLNGKLSLHANSRKEELLLDRYGAQGSITRFTNTKTGEEKDSLINEAITDPEALLVWTKAIRSYKNIPLREFVAQMSFWYGFHVKDYHCLPADRRITTTVCYQKDKEAVFAAIREAGVLLYEGKSMISFCPEDAQLPKNIGTMLALWE